jgi:hypothetical protein
VLLPVNAHRTAVVLTAKDYEIRHGPSNPRWHKMAKSSGFRKPNKLPVRPLAPGGNSRFADETNSLERSLCSEAVTHAINED